MLPNCKDHKPYCRFLLLVCAVFGLAGCGKKDDGDANTIRFQMGWYAQAERGGFFQAVVNGHFEKEGIEVTLLNGGPQNTGGAMLAAGEADIADLRLEEALSLIEKGFPIVMVATYMQHDPQGIMVHAESPIREMKDLAGGRVMARPGIPFLDVIKKKYDIDFSLIPLSGNAALFLSDPQIAQQCFITNEPFYAKRSGLDVRTILVSDIGFDLFRVIGMRKSYAEANPDVVRKFLRGMIAGWDDYLTSDNVDETFAMIKEMNPTLDEDGLTYARDVLIAEKLIVGRDNPKGIGWLDVGRVETIMNELVDIGFIEAPMDVSEFATVEFLESL